MSNKISVGRLATTCLSVPEGKTETDAHLPQEYFLLLHEHIQICLANLASLCLVPGRTKQKKKPKKKNSAIFFPYDAAFIYGQLNT